ncbi:POL5 [Hepatospora eriocheir]|uniref:POL5 n=1 Tax=Hepatospora eriocheir TaxID=1081669 RepID=A0A1X0QHS8_9MICR|nr:POL5 [Hepatospora eriocheir]
MELAKDNDKEKCRRNNSMMKTRIDDNKERKQDEVKKKKIICAKCGFIGHGIKDCRVKPDNYKVNKVEKNRKESFCCVQGNLKSLVPKVKVKVFDRTCIALIDTGASHVIVSRNLVANKMNKAKEVKELISTMVGKLRSIGLIEIALTIGNSTTCCDALIVDQSPYELILGMNLLKNYKLQISNDGIWLDNFKLSEGNTNPSNESKLLSLHAEAVETKNLLSNMTDEGKLNKFDNNYLGLLKARFQDVFDSSYKPSKIKLDPVIAVHENSKPIFKNVFKRNPKEEQSISQAVKNLLDLGIIEECSSPWSTNPFLVSKKDTDEKRMVIDYRDLNSITISKKFAIPRIDLTLDALSGAAIFTSLDLISGYHQFILDETDRDKTAFSCSSGQYRYKVLPMGLVKAPYIFQRVMTKLFKEYINVFVVVYLDDILVYSKDEESHFKHLNLVLEIIKEYGLTINLKKSKFFMSELLYLGYCISSNSVRISEEFKFKAINFKPPTNIRQLRCFLGFTSYARRFIKDYSRKAVPLYNLLKIDSFKFGDAELKAFEELKSAVQNSIILSLANFDDQFTLEVDANIDTVSAVLRQKSGIIACVLKE